MFFMTLLKVVFTIMICGPIVYLMLNLLVRLIDEVLKQAPKKKGRRTNDPNRSRAR